MRQTPRAPRGFKRIAARGLAAAVLAVSAVMLTSAITAPTASADDGMGGMTGDALGQQVEAFVAGLTEQIDAFVTSLTEGVDEFVSGLTEEIEGFVNDVAEEVEAFIADLADQFGDTGGETSSEG